MRTWLPGGGPREGDGGASSGPHGRSGAGDLALLCLHAAAGALGALPAHGGRSDPIALAAWLALVALPLGVLAGGVGPRLWPVGLGIPGAWLALLAVVDAGSPRDLPLPIGASAVLGGLFLTGYGLGRGAGTSFSRIVPAALSAGVLLALLPSAGGLGGPWSPEVAARLADLSPVALVLESGGVDWMRHPAVYEPVGTHSIGPELRTPWRGSLAGPFALLIGCAVVAIGGLVLPRLRGGGGVRR